MISVIECYCMTWLIVTKYLCHKGPGYIPFVVITIRSFPQSWFSQKCIWHYLYSKDLKIPKGQSGAINRKRTNNTIANKSQTIIYQALRRKQKIEQHNTTKTRDGLKCSGRVSDRVLLHDLVNRREISVSQRTRIYSVCRHHNPVLSSIMTFRDYHDVW
jgi:hypothetical protein